MIYTGTFLCQVDKMLRIILPKIYRSESLNRGGTLYIRKARNYFIATTESFLHRYLETISSGDVDDENVREIRRLAMAAVNAIHVDPQGRVKLSFFTDIKGGDTMIIVGTGHDFEIWWKNQWLKQHPDVEIQNE